MIVAVIPAKFESKRLPNKNLLKINGKSLIEHAVQYARRSSKIDHIYVSTDSKKIADHAKQLGVEVILRGQDLSGETPLIQVYRHALSRINNDRITHIVGIQPDNPDRSLSPDMAIDYAINKNMDNLFTVDKQGRHNGSLNILSLKALTANPSVYASCITDDCINIHSQLDYQMACRNLSEYADTITVSNRRIGDGQPTFIVAEAACNHMCDMEIACKMIDAAAEAGADAIKFQTYKAEKLVTTDAVAFWGENKISQLEYYKRLDRFGSKEYDELFRYSIERGLICFSSPFDAESAKMLNDVGMPIFKIASCDISNIRDLQYIADFGKPIILSTGASTPAEIDRAVEAIFQRGNYQLALLACTLSYPTSNEDANLLRIRTLRKRYPGLVVGLSDHTEPDSNMLIPSLAVMLGARILEKHYTLDRSMTGSGHFFAVNPNDLKKMVGNIRLAESTLGDGVLGVAESEKRAWEEARRGIVAEVNISKGSIIASDMLGFKRPHKGLCPSMIDNVVGKIATRDIRADEPITEDLLEQPQFLSSKIAPSSR